MTGFLHRRWAWAAAGILTIPAAILLVHPRATRAQSLTLSGILEQETVRVIPSAAGQIREVTAKEGDRVEAGALLLRLDDRDLRAHYDQLRALVGQATARIDAAASLSSLSPQSVQQLLNRLPEVQTAERAYVSALAETSQASADDPQAQRKLEDAAAHREQVWAKASSRWHTAFGSGEELTEQMREQLKLMDDQLAAMRVTAPVAGTVEILQLQPGDLVAPGLPVAEIAQADRFYVDVYVSADQLSAITEGHTVRVEAAGVKGLHGIVQHIARTPAELSLAGEEDTERWYLVRVKVGQPPQNVHAGMPVIVSFGAVE